MGPKIVVDPVPRSLWVRAPQGLYIVAASGPLSLQNSCLFWISLLIFGGRLELFLFIRNIIHGKGNLILITRKSS